MPWLRLARRAGKCRSHCPPRVRRFTWRFGTGANPKATRSRDPDLAPVGKKICRGEMETGDAFGDCPGAGWCRGPASAASQDWPAGIRLMSQSFSTCRGCPDKSGTAALRSCRVRGQCVGPGKQALQMNSLEKTMPAIRIKDTDDYA